MRSRADFAQRALTAIAGLKVGLGTSVVAMALVHPALATTQRDFLMLAIVVSFALAAALLMVWGKGDRRAGLLGIVFLLVAAVFSDTLLAPWQRADVRGVRWLQGFFALQVDAFLPFFLWHFVQQFPRPSTFGARHRLPQLAAAVSLWTGATLFVINVLYFAAVEVPSLRGVAPVLSGLTRDDSQGLYWPIQFALTLAAFPVLVWKAGGVSPAERRRIYLLVTAVTAGTAPTVLWVLLVSFSDAALQTLPLRLAGWVIYPALMATPLATAYAVLVHRALDVRVVIRSALRYALARYTVIAAAMVPFLLLLRAVYSRRGITIVELLQGREGLLLLALIALAILTLRLRRRLLERIDRAFFRQQYDSRRILSELVHTIEQCGTATELASTLRLQIDSALGLQAVHVLLRPGPGEDELVDPLGALRQLDAGSAIVESVAAAQQALVVDLARGFGSGAIRDTERYWLLDANVRLIVPIRHRRLGLCGLIALGEKRNEQPFTGEDRKLLAMVASAAALVLAALPEVERAAERVASPAAAAREAAAECARCHALYASGTRACSHCGGDTIRAALPLTVAGKFRLVARAGVGGMGVVYRGIDLALARTVAIKTLPRMAPDRAARLRSEARTMASVTHPNLAAIYAVESWQGMPVLVCEFLAAGTLADRLEAGALGTDQALEIGATLAGAAHALHRAGILHRDIKPSNVGFDLEGTAKLLDFGLASMMRGHYPVRGSGAVEASSAGPAAALPNLRVSEDARLAGTPIYLSPEAVAGLRPDPSFDVWSICMVLFEAITGVNPMADVELPRVYRRIVTCDLAVHDYPAVAAEPQLAAFFRRAFARDPSQRPRTAAALRQQIAQLQRDARIAVTAA